MSREQFELFFHDFKQNLSSKLLESPLSIPVVLEYIQNYRLSLNPESSGDQGETKSLLPKKKKIKTATATAENKSEPLPLSSLPVPQEGGEETKKELESGSVSKKITKLVKKDSDGLKVKQKKMKPSTTITKTTGTYRDNTGTISVVAEDVNGIIYYISPETKKVYQMEDITNGIENPRTIGTYEMDENQKIQIHLDAH
jgi:hypothetical protein